MLTLQEYSKTIMFPIGNTNDAYAKYFIGQSYLAPVSTEQVKIYNVTFEPKCRNNWHIHKAKSGGGQMLIAVGGRGYYQEWGKKPIEMKPGDVINIPANVKHWHGAAPDSWFYISNYKIERIMCVPTEKNFIFVIEKIQEDDTGISIRYMVEAAKIK